jgi:hypothetical protein
LPRERRFSRAPFVLSVENRRFLGFALSYLYLLGVRAPVASFVVSYGALKLLPFWDPLRGDPRFEKIVASLAPKEAK